jgi:hypothetical protein
MLRTAATFSGFCVIAFLLLQPAPVIESVGVSLGLGIACTALAVRAGALSDLFARAPAVFLAAFQNVRLREAMIIANAVIAPGRTLRPALMRIRGRALDYPGAVLVEADEVGALIHVLDETAYEHKGART